MDVGLVCDVCSTFSILGSSACKGCGQVLSLDGKATLMGKSAAELGVNLDDVKQPNNDCSTCGKVVAEGNKFCGACGTPVATKDGTSSAYPSDDTVQDVNHSQYKLPDNKSQELQTKLVLIKGEGYDGESYLLAGQNHRIGSSEGDIIFDEDPFLSPLHANFFFITNQLHVKDEGSINGVYLRISESYPITINDRFLVGEQVIQVRPSKIDPTLRPEDDGTYRYSSPSKNATFELVQILHGGVEGLTMAAEENLLKLGREECDLNFPNDPFISGNHAQVDCHNETLTLSDLGSKNGTFMQITKVTPLQNGDYIFLGQQLLRVEIF